MTQTSPLDPDTAWQAVATRDRSADGRFVFAVRSTGIYCRPSCPARRPRRENVAFYPDAAEAVAAGYRACLRCSPDAQPRDRAAVARALDLIAGDEGRVTLERLAEAVGYAPHHFHRVFRRATGMTPAAYARARRTERAADALATAMPVTEAIYAAGFAAPSRFYDVASDRLGMAPADCARGGAGVTIRWTVAATSLGPLLIAATPRGLCRVAFDEDETMLATRFPQAQVVAGDADLASLAARVVAAVEAPGTDPDLPRDVQGTAFQEAIWRALRTIPPGETRSYAQLAALADRPQAVRAAGSACGANPLAVLTPCHRVLRGDGAAGGYAWGADRKRALLAREQAGRG